MDLTQYYSKVGALLGLLTNQGEGDDMMEPPPLFEKLLGQDGEEMTKPLKGALDKLGVGGGDGPLSTVKMFIPPIGQGNPSVILTQFLPATKPRKSVGDFISVEGRGLIQILSSGKVL